MTPTTSMIALISDDQALAGPVHSLTWRAPWLANRSLQMTRHRPVVVGRRAFHYLTMLSADRWVFVVTRDEELLEAGGNHHLSGFGFWYMPDLDRALDAARSLAVSKRTPEVFVAGGVSVYQQALPQISRAVSHGLHEPVEATTRLDAGVFSGWTEVHAERRQRGSDGFADQTYSVIERPA